MSAADAEATEAERKPVRKKPRWILRLAGAVLFITVLLPVGLVGLYRFIDPPVTWTMTARFLEGEQVRRHMVNISRVSPNLVHAVIAAEDSRFCSHNGFDFEAIQDAIDYNERQEERGTGRRRGASTISQQTAKNLILWQGGGWFRKGLETYLTVLIEAMWPKRRIMEAYLNAAEWGDGAFGAEAAAQIHFGKSALDLSRREAARLAAVLPSPRRWDASEPGPYVRGRARSLQGRASVVRNEGLADCVLSP
jgi:monofunctional biosynthetic peptidoglycan transglycosylase